MPPLYSNFIFISGSWKTPEVDMYASSEHLTDTTAVALLAHGWGHTVDGVGKNAMWVLEWLPTVSVATSAAVAIENLAQTLCAELDIETRYSWTSKHSIESDTFKPVYVLT